MFATLISLIVFITDPSPQFSVVESALAPNMTFTVEDKKIKNNDLQKSLKYKKIPTLWLKIEKKSNY